MELVPFQSHKNWNESWNNPYVVSLLQKRIKALWKIMKGAQLFGSKIFDFTCSNANFFIRWPLVHISVSYRWIIKKDSYQKLFKFLESSFLVTNMIHVLIRISQIELLWQLLLITCDKTWVPCWYSTDTLEFQIYHTVGKEIHGWKGMDHWGWS